MLKPASKLPLLLFLLACSSPDWRDRESSAANGPAAAGAAAAATNEHGASTSGGSVASTSTAPSATPVTGGPTTQPSTAPETTHAAGAETARDGDERPTGGAPPAKGSAPAAPAKPAATPGAKPAQSSAWLEIDRGEGELPLLVPRAEELSFRVILDLGFLGDVEAGKVTLSSGVERFSTGLPPANSAARVEPEAMPESGWIRSFATGGYRGYHVEHELRTRLLPQAWPRIYYTDEQKGSENRRRELKLGLQDGETRAWYRNDGHCRGCENREHFVESNWKWGSAEHCKKCKRAEHRVWKTPTERTVPPQTVEMLSAVYLARTMVREGLTHAEFPMVDKQRLWDVHLRAGKTRRIEIPAGRFDCREVQLSTKLPAGEKRDADSKEFEGMFGIRGKIQIWMEARSGVPVLIEGELPVPLIGSLDVRVELERYIGTPPVFAPVE